jgi:Zn-finger nucleic acid-binding protein
VVCSSCGGSLQVGARACPYCRCTLATSRCGHCSAWNLASAQHCHACGRSLGGAAVDAGRAAGGPCLRCGAVLYPRLYAELDVDECDKCGGLFVEAEMMQKIVAQRTTASAHGLHLALPERPRARELDVRYLRCPACQKHMNRQVFARVSGVIVDVCKVHGVWFDGGELAASLAFIERGGMAKAHRRELDQLIEERRALRSAERGAGGGGPVSVDPLAQQATAWGDFTVGLMELWL